MPLQCVVGCLPFITLTNSDQMVCVAEIGEDGSSPDGFEGGREKWQRIFVFDGDLIQALIVNAGPQAFILLLHEEKPSSYRGRRWSDDPSC